METLVVPDEVGRALVGLPVTPFNRAAVALIEPPRVEVARPARMIASDQASAEPEDLAAEFLAAMAAAGEQV